MILYLFHVLMLIFQMQLGKSIAFVLKQSGTLSTAMQAVSRRQALVAGGLGITETMILPSSASASVDIAPKWTPQAASSQLADGLLETRVKENVQSPPPYGMELPDIFYPEWFAGTWNAESVTKEVLAPCGVALFGGNVTYQKALDDVGNVLRYESRFVSPASPGKEKVVVADREYNVKSIAKQAMGENSVVDVSTVTPNKFSCILAPKGSPSLLQVDLLVLNRRQETIANTRFDCSEVVREIASSVDRPKTSQAAASILKEIETANLYTYVPEKDEIHCLQRSAAFLLPSGENPLALRMWQASGGRAIDVRYYDIIYKRARTT